jgi:SAM-dependent methyltransferase
MYILRHFANAIINFTKHALVLQFFACGAWLWDMVVWTNDSLDLVLRRSRKVRCDCCGWSGNRFFLQTYVTGTRVHLSREICPKCLSLARQRQLVSYLKNKTWLLSLNAPLILDIGPSRAEVNWFQQCGLDIVTVDLMTGIAAIKMDMTRLGFKDKVFDFIICSHVLEHVSNDLMAMKEMLRLLKEEGICVIQVPIELGLLETVEYTRPKPDNFDHIRAYGQDFAARLNYAGFEIKYSDNGLFEVVRPRHTIKSI